MKYDNIKIIGLTGGVGSGKSTVSSYLAQKGFPVVDADKTAREVVAPGSPVLSRLAGVFGAGILNGDGTLNRRKLADIAFSESAMKERLDLIMHGEIYRIMRGRIDDLAEAGYTGLIFLDIPLLFETSGDLIKEMDAVWVVDADEETRIRRVMERDGILRSDVINIINNQMSSEKKREKAHIVIDNSGSEEALYMQLDNLIKSYEK